MRKLKMYCRRGFAWLLIFTLCMGSMQNVAFASDDVNVEVVETTDNTVDDDTTAEDSEEDGASEENEAAEEAGEQAEDTSSDENASEEEASAEENGSQENGEENSVSVEIVTADVTSQEAETEASSQEATEEVASQESVAEATTEAASGEDETQKSEETVTEETTESTEETSEETTTEASEETGTDETEGSVMTLEDAVEVAESTEATESTEAAENTEKGEWDITQTQRPGASDEVTFDKGTSEDKLHIEDKNWDIFYDAEKDVYKITFNIKGDANAATQTIDLTQALELLGQYAESGKQELEEAKSKVEKPVMGELEEEPKMADIGEKPQAPVAEDAPKKPEVEEPVMPGKPAGLDDALSGFISAVMKDNSILSDSNAAENYLAGKDFDVTDSYVKEFAQYMLNAADNANDKNVIATGQPVGYYNWLVEYLSPANGWDENGNRVIYTREQRIQMAKDCLEKDTPVEPVYTVDKTSQAYQDYLAAQEAYDKVLAEYEAAQEAWLAEHGPESPEYQKYLAELEAYNKAKAEAEAEYKEALAAYQAKKAEIEAKYADDQAAYDAAIKALEADFDRRIEANVLQPGDVKKFELYITSDSKHTYKYQSGSFTLATPGWTTNPDGTVTGFDGQILPEEYVDHAKYYITLRSEPIQAMLESLGMDAFDRFNGSYPAYWNSDIKDFLDKYPGETVDDKLNAYILAFYGNEYATIDELIKNNPDARTELTKTETSGNKNFKINGKEFVVDAHLETVKYDTFYKQLFSFAFGQEADLDKFLGEAIFNSGTNRWEYANDSWTDNGYKQALYYYMDHKEIWQKTDAYFNALLDGGLTADQATWTSLMMALNIDGELTGNTWQNTQWPWYSSIGLERMDIDFNLNKTDGETKETITDSEAEFQVYYIDNVKGEDGTETSVKMYCTYNAEDNTYTFVTTPSTVWTKDGQLNINYAMMKDIVYYLQEMKAPEGYERDINVYIVMSEDDYNNLTDEDKAALDGTFDKFLDLTKSEDGLSISTDFVNVKIVPTTPDPEPTTPPTDPDPSNPGSSDEPNEPTTNIPDPGVPLTLVPDPEVPLANIPDGAVPLISIMDEDVPLASVPKTGDVSSAWYTMTILSACCLLVVGMLDKKKREEENG